MQRRVLLLALPALLAMPLPGAVAQIDDCTAPSPGTPSHFANFSLVVTSRAYRDFIYAAPCWSVVGGSPPIPACNPGNSGVAQWCPGISVAAGATVHCAWYAPLPSTIFDYAVGIDVNGDGNIYPGEPAYTTGRSPFVPAVPQTLYDIDFMAPVAGTLIGYPVSMVVGGFMGDLSYIGCK